MLFLLDAWLYAVHRALHHFPALWRIHAVHHSQYAPQFHLIEFMFLWLIPLTVAHLAGYPNAMFVIAFVFVYEVTLTHRKVYKTSNVVHKYLFKVAKGFVSNAKYHKVHHDNPGKNFSQLFTIWDSICRTKLKRQGA